MKMYNDFSDERLRGNCTYCNAIPTTRDHIPSKVFLSKPYPSNLQVVPAGEACNNTFSKDELFLAFLIDYLIMLASPSSDALMDLIKERYSIYDSLESRVFDCITKDSDGRFSIKLENSRIENVLLKFAACHMFYETGTKMFNPPSHLTYWFLRQMTSNLLYEFNNPAEDPIFPELGSRLMQRIFAERNSWITIQEGKYRYYINAGTTCYVRLAIREFLFCEAIGDE